MLLRTRTSDAEMTRRAVAELWNLIDEKLSSVETERNRWINDETVRRFYKAHNRNIVKTFRRMRETWEWRQSNGVDYALDPESEIYMQAKEEGANGQLTVLNDVDSQNRVYVLWRPFEELSEKFESLVVYTMERAKLLAGTNGIVLIVDCVSYSGTRGIRRETAMRLSTILTRHYPGCLDSVIVVNARISQKVKYFAWSWGLPIATRRKVWFVKDWGNGFNWRRYRVDGTRIPEELGGSYPYELNWDSYITEVALSREMTFENSSMSV